MKHRRAVASDPLRVAQCVLLCALGMLAACGETAPRAEVAGGDPERGRATIERFGCTACHAIPRVPSYGGNVGPPLDGIGARAYLAGVLPNTPENMVRWLLDPPQVAPRTVMPRLGLTPAEAADVAAYLGTLR